jgi:uncharacterized protein YutE (UPF0331/DUF86 family)
VSQLDRQLLAEKAANVQRHLDRVAGKLPEDPAALGPMSDASDAVILHLWQAVQIIVDLALSACVHFGVGAPASYGEAFRRLAAAGRLDAALAERLVRASGFRNVLVHAYEGLDMSRVHRAAKDGPADLRAFLAAIRDQLSG